MWIYVWRFESTSTAKIITKKKIILPLNQNNFFREDVTIAPYCKQYSLKQKTLGRITMIHNWFYQRHDTMPLKYVSFLGLVPLWNYINMLSKVTSISKIFDFVSQLKHMFKKTVLTIILYLSHKRLFLLNSSSSIYNRWRLFFFSYLTYCDCVFFQL